MTREQGDTHALMGVLNLCLKNNFAGIENFSLYSQSFHGTKHLIEQYYQEVERALYYLEKSSLDVQVKRTFYRVAAKNFGKTALCLSGGASFAYYHFGVVKALLDTNLLPTIVSGTSAGGLIAALVCTRARAHGAAAAAHLRSIVAAQRGKRSRARDLRRRPRLCSCLFGDRWCRMRTCGD